MTLRGHKSITATGRATHLGVGWLPRGRASFGLNTCPNTNSHSATRLAGFNGIGSEQPVDYSQMAR